MVSIRGRIQALLLAAAVVLGLGAGPAFAQTQAVNIAPPPEKFEKSPGGVDMRSGKYMYSQTDLAIPGVGFDLTRTMMQQVVDHINPFADFSHNWDIMVAEKQINIVQGIFRNTPGQPDREIQFAFGGRSHTFRKQGNTAFQDESRSNYAIISYTAPGGDVTSPSVVYTLQTSDGTTAVFRPLGDADCSSDWRCAYVSQVTQADGTVYTFEYDATGGANTTRLRSITSNRGYAMLFEYVGSYVSKACIINLTLTTKPANNVCPAGVPAATYTYNSVGGATALASVTDPSGAVWGFSGGADSQTSIAFTKPGQSTPWLTNSYATRLNDDGLPEHIVSSQSFADGQSYTYTFDVAPQIDFAHVPPIAGGTFTDALGHGVVVEYDFPLMPHGSQGFGNVPTNDQDVSSPLVYQVTPGPIAVIDEIGRTTTADYCDPNAEANLPASYKDRCIVSPAAVTTTDPGGFKTDLSWDFLTRHLVQTHRYATAGSGLSDVIESAGYNCFPTTILYCDKPTLVIDAKGNTTTYTYDPAHGGMLTETDPAVNGVTPQKRYSYAQRYAWISNGAGGNVHAASPVYVLTQVSSCKAGNPNATSTGCALAGDEVITTYDYGPDAGPNNLLLRGTVVDSGGLNLRSCMAYDAYGNKISETKPRAGLASCP